MTARHFLIAMSVVCLALAGTVRPARGAPEWTWPVGAGPPEMVRAFDPPVQRWQPGHRGVDLATTKGALVRAAGAGVVTYAGLVAGIGIVTVTHGELRTTYQPVDPGVSVGDHVEPGEPIALVTLPGSHCMPDACLHWGLLRGDAYLDPATLVAPEGRPRLLPIGPLALGSGTKQATAPHAQQATGRVAEQAVLGALAGLVHPER